MGDYHLPIYYGLLSEDFVLDQMDSNTYDEADFSREYGSKWTNQNADSLFDYDQLTKIRTIKKAEWKAEDRDNTFYILAVDVARSAARTVFEVIKVSIGEDYYVKKVVNIQTIQGGSFLFQTLKIKELDTRFNFNRIVIDANGLGVGLVDFLMIENFDKGSGIVYGPYNIDNIKDYPIYAQEQKVSAPPKLFLIKTNQHNAGDIHTNCYKEIMGGRVKLLVDPKVAREKLLSTDRGRKMGIVERDRFLAPYKNTTLLVDETSNIKIRKQTVGFMIELIDGSKEKDTFSALEYGLSFITTQERKYYAHKRKPKGNWGSAMFLD